MIFRGLPDSFKLLAVHITQNEDNVTFTDFKRRLRIYEAAERMKTTKSVDNVMKAHIRQGRALSKSYSTDRKNEDTSVTCYKCGVKDTKPENATKRYCVIIAKIVHMHSTIPVQEKERSRWC